MDTLPGGVSGRGDRPVERSGERPFSSGLRRFVTCLTNRASREEEAARAHQDGGDDGEKRSAEIESFVTSHYRSP